MSFSKPTTAHNSVTGMTLIEMLISLSLLGVIISTVLAIYVMGFQAWRKGDVRGDLLAAMQVSSARLVGDIEKTNYASVSIGPTGDSVALLSAIDSAGQFQLDPNGRPIWQRWVVYYQSAGELLQLEVPWTAPPADRVNPLPIEHLGGSLADYLSGGRVVARNLYDFEVSVIPDTPMLELRLDFQKSSGRQTEQVEMKTLIKTRN